MLRKLFKIISALIIICIGLTVLIVIQELRRSKTEESIEKIQKKIGVPVTVVHPVKRTFTDYLITDGNVTAEERVVLRSRIPEVVTKVQVKTGERVKKGQLLIEFREDDLKATAEARKTAVKEARNNYKRYQSLHKEGHVTLQQVEQSKTILEDALADLREAQSNLSFTKLTSPINGVIETRYVDPGEFQGAGQPLFDIIDISKIAVKAQVPATFIDKIDIGNKAEYKVEGQKEWHKKTITRIRPSTDNPNRFFEVYLDMTNKRTNKAWRMRPGMYTEVRFPKKHFTSVLSVPKESVSQSGGNYHLFGIKTVTESIPVKTDKAKPAVPEGLLNKVKWSLKQYLASWKKNKAEKPEPGKPTEMKKVTVMKSVRIDITPGIQTDGFIQIKNAGTDIPDRLIAHPTEDLQDGQKINIRAKGDSDS